MKSTKCLDVFVIGAGGVGRALIGQLRSAGAMLRSDRNVQLRLVGMADRSGLLHSEGGLPDELVGRALTAKLEGATLVDVSGSMSPVSHFSELASPRTVFVDVTAAKGMASTWGDMLDTGAGIVLANKLPLCEAWSESACLYEHPRVRYEATVGAGLPVMSTLRSLLATNDSIERMSGALSGTLGYLVGRLSAGDRFSDALSEATKLGYAEPDPSDDLSGRDVARKAVILARSVGWCADLSDVALEGLLPCDASPGSGLDEQLRTKFAAAAQDGVALRYLARIAPEGIRVGLMRLSHSDSFASMIGPENRVSFQTKRYGAYPLAIAGPGAGLDVTAAGILSDLIDLAEHTSVKGESL